ncbi:hypothetical protein JCM10213v2_007356 [Rhodosporidiobolus nylandii]
MMQSVPNEVKCYCFEQEGGELKMGVKQMQKMKDSEVCIKVHLCALSSADEITRFNLVEAPKDQWNGVPGCCVVGEVVKCGEKAMMGEGKKAREGMHVVACSGYGGLAGLCLAEASMCCELTKAQATSMHEMACVGGWCAVRVHCAWMDWEKRMKSMDKEILMMREMISAKMGMWGEGCVCVYGEGGYAKLACDLLKTMMRHSGHKSMSKAQVLLVTPSDRWAASDYGMAQDCVLCIGKCDLPGELKKRGGVMWCCATDMPNQWCPELMAGMCYGCEMVVLNPCKNEEMKLPMGMMLAKHLTVCGAPMPSSLAIKDCLAMCEKAAIRVKTECVKFEDENKVKEAWRKMEQGECFEAPVVEVMQGGRI